MCFFFYKYDNNFGLWHSNNPQNIIIVICLRLFPRRFEWKAAAAAAAAVMKTTTTTNKAANQNGDGSGVWGQYCHSIGDCPKLSNYDPSIVTTKMTAAVSRTGIGTTVALFDGSSWWLRPVPSKINFSVRQLWTFGARTTKSPWRYKNLRHCSVWYDGHTRQPSWLMWSGCHYWRFLVQGWCREIHHETVVLPKIQASVQQ